MAVEVPVVIVPMTKPAPTAFVCVFLNVKARAAVTMGVADHAAPAIPGLSV